MAPRIDALLNRIYEEGQSSDASESHRAKKMLNITPATGELLHWLINDLQPGKILELGTSNGYSTIWMGRAAQMVKARVTSIEFMPTKISKAVSNIRAAGLQGTIDLHLQSIGKYLVNADNQAFDFVFLDSDRLSYAEWWYDLKRVTQFGTLVVDNAISHAEELADFCNLVRADGFSVRTYAIGNGQMIVRAQDDALCETVDNELRSREESNE